MTCLYKLFNKRKRSSLSQVIQDKGKSGQEKGKSKGMVRNKGKDIY